jgi:hypothetical protein
MSQTYWTPSGYKTIDPPWESKESRVSNEEYEPHWGFGHPTMSRADCPWCNKPKLEIQWTHNPEWGSIEMLTILEDGIIRYRSSFTKEKIESFGRESIEKTALEEVNGGAKIQR